MGSTSGREQPAEGSHRHRPALAAPHPPGISPLADHLSLLCGYPEARPPPPGAPTLAALHGKGWPMVGIWGGGRQDHSWGVGERQTHGVRRPPWGARLKHCRRGRGGGVDGLQGASCCLASRGEGWGLWLSASPSPQPEPAPPSQPAHLPLPPPLCRGPGPGMGEQRAGRRPELCLGRCSRWALGHPRSPQLTFHLPRGLLRSLLVDSVQALLFLLCSLSLRQSPSVHILEIYLKS